MSMVIEKSDGHQRHERQTVKRLGDTVWQPGYGILEGLTRLRDQRVFFPQLERSNMRTLLGVWDIFVIYFCAPISGGWQNLQSQEGPKLPPHPDILPAWSWQHPEKSGDPAHWWFGHHCWCQGKSIPIEGPGRIHLVTMWICPPIVQWQQMWKLWPNGTNWTMEFSKGMKDASIICHLPLDGFGIGFGG